MAENIRIQMIGNFAVYTDNRKIEYLINKSRKGANLIQFLILHRGEAVPNYRILSALWADDRSANPENAMKTLVSRIRAMLNQISPSLGACIVADRGAYHWECSPNMTVDLYEIDDLFAQIRATDKQDKKYLELCARAVELYNGDILQENNRYEWITSYASKLHNEYMSIVYSYIEILKQQSDFMRIAEVCKTALEVDSYDDRLQMEMMNSMIKIGRGDEIVPQYHFNRKSGAGIMGAMNEDELYSRIERTGRTLDFNLESIRNELRESGAQQGAFVCEYPIFKEIYHLQVRNLERLGGTMFLGIVMVQSHDEMTDGTVRQNELCTELMETMRRNLRKGDAIARFSPTMIALLLPTVNYGSGNMVMERIKRLFLMQHPDENITFNYRVGPLVGEEMK